MTSLGFIVGINSTNNVVFVLKLDSGIRKLTFNNCLVRSFNTGLYFNLQENITHGMLSTLSELASSAHIIISPLPATVSNFAITNVTIAVMFNSSSYPFVLSPSTLTMITGAVMISGQTFGSFINKVVTIPLNSLP